MRTFLMIASAAAMAVSMPALAKEKGGGGGGGKPEKVEKHRGGGGGGGHGGGGGGKHHKAEFRGGGGGGKHFEKRHEEARKHAEKRFEERGKRREERRKFAEKRFEKSEKRFEKAEKRWAKAEKKHWKSEAKRAERLDRYEGRRYDDRYDDGRRYAAGYDCPPGLARKNNGCLPPGQAKKLFDGGRAFAIGQALPVAYYSDYNIPAEYQNWYRDTPESYYRYDDSGYIYQVDRQSSLIESLIPLLGGGFGVGSLLPSGYDAYNLPMQYRDDFVDTADASYRYGDDAIYRVDPQSQMIEAVVALLAGDLNVGQLLPDGYDAYNLPMDYRDDYVDDADSMYRYADGNIYEIDPQTQIIEQIVASLI